MIIGDSRNPEKAGLSPTLLAALKFALEANPQECEPGCHVLQGDDIFMNVMQFMTQPAQAKRAELHEEYIDVQILLAEKNALILGLSTAPGSAMNGTVKRITSCVMRLRRCSLSRCRPGCLRCFSPASRISRAFRGRLPQR